MGPRSTRVYGGFFLQLWYILSAAKDATFKKFGEEHEEFLEGPAFRHFMVNFFEKLGDRTFRVNLEEAALEPVTRGLRLMQENLFEFDEIRAELIDEILTVSSMQRDWAVHRGHEFLDDQIFEKILRFILEIIFKSTNYKIPEEQAVEEKQENKEEN